MNGVYQWIIPVSELDVEHTAATVFLARVGLGAHDSFLDFLDESSQRVDVKRRKDKIDNDRNSQYTFIAAHESGLKVNIHSKENKFKDDASIEHADVVLASSHQLKEVETNIEQLQ